MTSLIKSFFLRRIREELVDAVRNTIVVVLPLLVLFPNHKQAGVGITVGALLMSLTDLPGNRQAKSTAALQALVVTAPVTLIFSAALSSTLLTGIALVSFTFLLSMMASLGTRSGAVGAMGIALMVFSLGLKPTEPWIFTGYILIGGGWFYLVTLLQVYLWPYRSLHQALREALSATAAFLEAKASCYNPDIPLETCYRQIIRLNMKVAEKQELVRSLLLSDESNERASYLLSRAIAVIHLYEQATAMHFDYAEVRNRLGLSKALVVTQQIVGLMAVKTKVLANVFPSKNRYNDEQAKQLETLLNELTLISETVPKEEAAVIKGIIKNTKAIDLLVGQIADTNALLTSSDSLHISDYRAFLPESGTLWTRWKEGWSFNSPVLRFALRLSVLFAAGYLAAVLLVKDNYSYWLLLTILIVARPRLAVTWQRNMERLAGTFVGVVTASLCIWLIKPAWPLLVLAAVTLTGFYNWNRTRYSLSVVCITVCVLLSLSLAHGHPEQLVVLRISYTLIGCIMTFFGLFIFPIWAGRQLENLALASMEGNTRFLDTVLQANDRQDGWLARKEAHLRLARFSEGLRHARLEPGGINLSRLEQIQILHYRINALITSLFLAPVQNHVRNAAGKEVYKKGNLLKGKALLESLLTEVDRLLVTNE